MSILHMPIVEALLETFCKKDFSKVRIIGVQHILETTHAMFQHFYRYGLQPRYISILGKCYSTCKDVFNEMKDEGIDVSLGSFSYQSHQSFDSLFKTKVHSFLKQRLPDLLEEDYETIIVLDDGGKCINVISKYLRKTSLQVVAIEQTSAGYNDIKDIFLPFPVINVARSPIKLTHESPMIAQVGTERLYQSLQAKNIYTDSVLIIGGGPIGQAMKMRLKGEMLVSIFDENKRLSDFSKKIFEILPLFNLIIGCTGKTSIVRHYHDLLSKAAVLVSVSSSDREFDSVYLRKKVKNNHDCHQDILVENRLLVNSGFPVNFDGGRKSVDTENIQLTIALIVAAILQALEEPSFSSKELIPLTHRFENFIETQFLGSQKLLTSL